MPPLTPGQIASSADLFDKLKRDAALFNDRVTSDGLFNFVVTGYSLIDWVKSDPVTKARPENSRVIDALYKDPWLQVCGDVATAAKHFALTSRKPITENVVSRQGFGLGRYGAGEYTVGEEEIVVVLTDGSEYSVLQLVEGVLATWSTYFGDGSTK